MGLPGLAIATSQTTKQNKHTIFPAFSAKPPEGIHGLSAYYDENAILARDTDYEAREASIAAIDRLKGCWGGGVENTELKGRWPS